MLMRAATLPTLCPLFRSAFGDRAQRNAARREGLAFQMSSVGGDLPPLLSPSRYTSSPLQGDTDDQSKPPVDLVQTVQAGSGPLLY